MYSIGPAGRGGEVVRRPFPGLVVFGVLLFLVLAALTSSHAFFPFFPLLLLLFAMRMIGRNAVWGTGTPDSLPAGIDREKELLEVLERRGETTAAIVALETSLSVTEAEEMLSGLANAGHVRVVAKGGRLAYALWE
jgi:hypothetical protein